MTMDISAYNRRGIGLLGCLLLFGLGIVALPLVQGKAQADEAKKPALYL